MGLAARHSHLARILSAFCHLMYLFRPSNGSLQPTAGRVASDTACGVERMDEWMQADGCRTVSPRRV